MGRFDGMTPDEVYDRGYDEGVDDTMVTYDPIIANAYETVDYYIDRIRMGWYDSEKDGDLLTVLEEIERSLQ